MGLGKLFKKMKSEDRIKWAMLKKKQAEKDAMFWTRICRKLVQDRDFTPSESDWVDTILEKENG